MIMRGTVAKIDRKDEERRNAVEIAAAAYRNEALTRERVDKLEALLNRNLLGRLRWLLTGE